MFCRNSIKEYNNNQGKQRKTGRKGGREKGGFRKGERRGVVVRKRRFRLDARRKVTDNRREGQRSSRAFFP